MDRNFAMEFVRVTEMAALASSRYMGRGDEKAADQAAVDAMRRMLNSVQFDGRVVIGEGEKMPAAFIQPNYDYLKDWAAKEGVDIGDLHEEISASGCRPMMWHLYDIFREDIFKEKFMLYVKR